MIAHEVGLYHVPSYSGSERIVSEDSLSIKTSLIPYFLVLPFPSFIFSLKFKIFRSPFQFLCSPSSIKCAISQKIEKFFSLDDDKTGNFKKYGITLRIISCGLVTSKE